MKENKSPKDAAIYRKRDYITNKLLVVFTLAFALLILLMNIGRMMKSTTTFIAAFTTVRVISYAAIAVTVLGIIMMIVEHAKSIDTKYKLLSGKNIAIGALFVAICTSALSFIFSQTMLMLLYVFIPTVVVLYIIYYSYQREFFMIAFSCIVGGIGIWLLGSDIINSSDIFAIIGAAVAVVVCAVITMWAQIGGGKIKLGKKALALFKSEARYGIVYLTFVLVLMLLAAAFLVADLSMYFLFGLIGYIVLTGVYYTVKLI